MKIAIIAVGRSGTTFFLDLLNKVLVSNSSNRIEQVYEPFLWDRTHFSNSYNKDSENFHFMDSLSIEGMFNHQKLPLFINNNSLENEYVKSLFNPLRQDTTQVVLKFIRANGRFRLLKSSYPNCKFIFLIRNPIDVINSSIKLFSLFGDDFHKSDYDRFCDELKAIYPLENHQFPLPGRVLDRVVEREILYWYYMNRFALETFSELPEQEKPLLVCYEDFVANPESYLSRICNHLDIDSDITFQKSERVGPSFSSCNISQKEYLILKEYMGFYQKLLESFPLISPLNTQKIYQKYESRLPLQRLPVPFHGNTPVYIQQELYGKNFSPS